MNVNEKILQYIEFKGLSQRKFTMSLGLAEGVLRRGKNIGSGYLKRIKTNYPDLNLDWVLFGEGEMIIDPQMVSEETAVYKKEVTLDELVDKKIQDKLDKVEEMLKEIITNQIDDEIIRVEKEISKNGQKS
tara:strand:+ start:110 stop:502 length:393 start_codon:yes stop_codon:yes gene_type:complete